MTGNRLNFELYRLVNAAVAGQLTDDDRRSLDALLRADDRALDVFLNYCQLETDLLFHIRATLAGRRVLADLQMDGPIAEPELQTPVPHRAVSGWRRVSAARSVAAIGASIVLVFFLWQVVSNWREIPALRQPQPIARYIEGTTAKWHGQLHPAIGHNFLEGDSVVLDQGQARISMASGAELLLRAPCRVTLASAEKVELQEGVVMAQVAEWGRGFTVSTPELDVVDLGTKFAVSASRGGVAEAHVLNGQVRIQPLMSNIADRRSLLLSGGEAIRVESERGVTTRLAADKGRFDAELSSRPPFKPIDLHNTGMGLAPGDEDPHWRVVSGPKSSQIPIPEFAVVSEADTRYLANDPGRSQWISVCNPVRPGCPPNTMFTFETSFDLAGYALPTVVVAAQVIADNGVRAVRLNGELVPFQAWELNEPGQYFNEFYVIEINRGFVPGVNTIQFDVWNGVDRGALTAPNPMSLRVEWRAFGREIAAPTQVRNSI